MTDTSIKIQHSVQYTQTFHFYLWYNTNHLCAIKGAYFAFFKAFYFNFGHLD